MEEPAICELKELFKSKEITFSVGEYSAILTFKNGDWIEFKTSEDAGLLIEAELTKKMLVRL